MLIFIKRFLVFGGVELLQARRKRSVKSVQHIDKYFVLLRPAVAVSRIFVLPLDLDGALFLVWFPAPVQSFTDLCLYLLSVLLEEFKERHCIFAVIQAQLYRNDFIARTYPRSQAASRAAHSEIHPVLRTWFTWRNALAFFFKHFAKARPVFQIQLLEF